MVDRYACAVKENDVITLISAGGDSCEVDVLRGGRVAQIIADGHRLLIDPGPAAERDAASTGWGSYPMAPWAGRVRHGRFHFFGTDYRLRLNQQDAPGDERRHAMHGTVFTQPWTRDAGSDNSVTLSRRLDDASSGWPFPGLAHQTIEILDGQLRCDLSIEVDHHPDGGTTVVFPGEIGWHPWFVKPDVLVFHPDAMYECDEIGLPTGHLVAPARGPWDDCFVNTAPVTLEYERRGASTVTISSDCDHWVVYDMPAHAICVEPQSGPPDAFNIHPHIVTATHPLRRTMNISW